jgi:hypothetical protein
MFEDLPASVRAADRAHHAILEEVVFSRHLNPTNAEEARRVFVRERRDAPPFHYQPLPDADALRRRLDALQPPRSHPAGDLVARCVDSTRLLVEALATRDAGAFSALADAHGWMPAPTLLTGWEDALADDGEGAAPLPAGAVIAALDGALRARGLRHWRVIPDTVLAARVVVDGAKRELRVHPGAHFREGDAERLVVHEIDVHARRAENGAAQPLRVFQTGLPGALLTEEGLAMVAEQRAGLASAAALARQVTVCRAVRRAAEVGFRPLYDELCAEVGPGLAWSIALRVKRGLAHPEEPGVYAKDSVYLAGYVRVRAWLDAGGPLHWLYVGKVGVDDPVGDWLDAGWLRPGATPEPWGPRPPG